MIIQLREPGHYVITIPDSFDIKIALEQSESYVTHDSVARTLLHVNCLDVNEVGESGMSTRDRQSWTYCRFGTVADPRTTITTRGVVVLLTQNALQQFRQKATDTSPPKVT